MTDNIHDIRTGMTSEEMQREAEKSTRESIADALIGSFFHEWTQEMSDEDRALFHLQFLRVAQQITLEAARPYHALMTDLTEKMRVLTQTMQALHRPPAVEDIETLISATKN